MDTTAGFEILATFPPESEDLTLEISYKDEFFLLVSEDEDPTKTRVAIHPRKEGAPWEFSMSELETILKKAANRLWELRRVDEPKAGDTK